MLVAALSLAISSASAQGLGDFLGNLVEGVLSKSNVSIHDLVGSYKSEGPAVSFKSDNFLKKAGGVAAAAAVEAKLAPYYEQYGLNSATLVVNPDSTFTLGMRLLSLSGTISKANDDSFIFNFMVMKSIPVGSVEAFISKGPSTVDLLFDASKLINVVQTVSKFVNTNSLKLFSEILSSYDGLLVGFKLKSDGSASSSSPSSSSQGSSISSPGNKTQDSGNSSNETNVGSGSNQSSGLDALKNILSGKGKKKNKK